MKPFFLLVFLFPLFSPAQSDLTGIWRLKDSKVVKGPDYTNALPHTLIIRQDAKVILLEAIINVGEKDTIVSERLDYGNNNVNESKTKGGNTKRVFFNRVKNSTSAWIKETEVFIGNDTGKLQSINKEWLTIWKDGLTLSLLRDYNGTALAQSYPDFTISLTFTKVTPEQLSNEKDTGNGVKFTEGLSWEQIRAKAQKEKKYIFVDCYATWCKPCHIMDKYVFPLNNVGEVMNKHFVPVKVQMDTGKNDPPSIKMLYSLARTFEKEYNISALPSYLFFSPEGYIVHKTLGQQNATKFIDLLKNVQKPEEQIYLLVDKAKRKQIPWKGYPALIQKVKTELKDKKIANELAAIYNQNYLNNLTEKELLQKEQFDFTINNILNIVTPDDKYFQILLNKPDLIDSIVGSIHGWSDFHISETINRNLILPVFSKAEAQHSEPDWTILEQQLSMKLGRELSVAYILKAKFDWYEKKENWSFAFQYLKTYMEIRNSKIAMAYLHHYAWKVFKHSHDKDLIKEAINWSEVALKLAPQHEVSAIMDTKACLLYKVGKKNEGIALMEKLQDLEPKATKFYKTRVESMKRDEDIWLTFR